MRWALGEEIDLFKLFLNFPEIYLNGHVLFWNSQKRPQLLVLAQVSSYITMSALTQELIMESSQADPVDRENEIDIALMSRIASGDIRAFEELVNRHQYALVGTVGKMLGGNSAVVDAEDIAQQVFLRIWKSAKRYKPTAKFTTWMFTIMRNLVFNESRRRKRRPEVSVEEREESSHLQNAADEHLQPDNEALQSELQKAVDQAIAELPEKQRMAVILRRYENMPYEDIAEVLELSVSAVKSQLFRARTVLRDSLQSYLEE